jgi:serine/threonine protein phosphatase PrpC
MALFDTAQRDLYVACSGDSRAIAGIWEEREDGTGSWRVEVLSEDQTGRNPNELKRYVPLPPVSHKQLISKQNSIGAPSRRG